MKKSKKVVAFAMALVCVFSLLSVCTPKSQVMAATTKSYTLVKGEVFSFTNYLNKVASCSVKKKSIAMVKKDSEDDKSVIVTAKKAGTTTVTVKYKGGSTQKINFKVVNPNFTVKTVGESDSYVFFSVKNSTKVFFDRLAVKYALKTADGEVVKQDVDRVYRVAPGSTAYFSVSKGYGNEIDVSKSSGKVVTSESYRDLNYTCTDQKSKIKVSKSVTDDGLKLKWRNTTKESISAVADVVFYDAEGHIVYVETTSKFLNAKEIDTSTVYISNSLEYDHYKILVRGYSEKYKR